MARLLQQLGVASAPVAIRVADTHACQVLQLPRNLTHFARRENIARLVDLVRRLRLEEPLTPLHCQVKVLLARAALKANSVSMAADICLGLLEDDRFHAAWTLSEQAALALAAESKRAHPRPNDRAPNDREHAIRFPLVVSYAMLATIMRRPTPYVDNSKLNECY